MNIYLLVKNCAHLFYVFKYTMYLHCILDISQNCKSTTGYKMKSDTWPLTSSCHRLLSYSLRSSRSNNGLQSHREKVNNPMYNWVLGITHS